MSRKTERSETVTEPEETETETETPEPAPEPAPEPDETERPETPEGNESALAGREADAAGDDSPEERAE